MNKKKPPNPTRGIYRQGEIYWLNFQRDGVRRFISLETRDQMEAIRRADRIRNGPELAPRGSFAADIESFLAHKRSLNIFSRATERVHGAALREFEAVCGLSARDCRPSHLQSHYERLQGRVAETTAQIHMRALRSFFSWSVKTHRATENPVTAVKLRRIDQPARLRYCTKAERDELIHDAPSDDLRFILFCGFHCGLRKNEIIEARVGWFDFVGGSLNVQNTLTFRAKDREARHIPISQEFRRFLEGFMEGADRLAFALRPCVKHGKGTYRYDFHRPFNDYLVQKGLRDRVTAHVMRHTFASLLVQSGVSVYKVARWLGDGVEVVERHYAHLAPQDADIERMFLNAPKEAGERRG